MSEEANDGNERRDVGAAAGAAGVGDGRGGDVAAPLAAPINLAYGTGANIDAWDALDRAINTMGQLLLAAGTGLAAGLALGYFIFR